MRNGNLTPAEREKLQTRIATILREARKRAELTQAEVAERVGVVPEVYGRLERGQMMPSVPTLWHLCTTLQVPSDVLLGLGGDTLPEWTEPPLEKKEPAALRQVLRTLRKLGGEELKLMKLLATALSPSKPPP